MNIEIKQLTAGSSALEAAFEQLMPQLSERLTPPDPEQISRIVSSPTTALFAALDGEHIMGLLTLVWYDVPSGRKAWIEDVVVDRAARGCGVGRALVSAALHHCTKIHARKLMLTSSEHRTEARALYRKMGFGEAQTTLFDYNH